MKGEETDSDLEEYYRELGIEHEVDELKKESDYKKKPKKTAKAVKPTSGAVAGASVSKEDIRKKVMNDLIENTKTNPSYQGITRVIKIVK